MACRQDTATRPPSVYYQDEQITLYRGDCREVDAWLDADVLVTDPPYGIAWSRGARKRTASKTGDAGIRGDTDTSVRDQALESWGTKPALVFGSLRASYPAGWSRMLVFQKPTVGSGIYGNRSPWLTNWEPVFVLGQWPDQTPTRSSVVATRWSSASGYSGYVTVAGHSHAKPLDVMEELIDACPPGVIADPFAGGGSTLIAAKALGRRAVGVEVDEKYCEVIAKRLAQGVLDFGAVS